MKRAFLLLAMLGAGCAPGLPVLTQASATEQARKIVKAQLEELMK